MASSDGLGVKNKNDGKIGQVNCPKCGSTDISLNPTTGKLRCNFCRFEFEPVVAGNLNDSETLTGEVIGSGATNIVSEDEILTLKCESCGAPVVIDTSSKTQARCHWCRSFLSINSKMPNGAVPDVVLPFKITKEEAQKAIEEFVGKRKFFAHPKFSQEFTTANIMGVYFPYMLVDVNAKCSYDGEGEHLVRSYMVGDKDHREMRYDADLYQVNRDFNLFIDDLTIESSLDKLDTSNANKTNNIINAIMPFDTENCVKWDANFLRGYTSEKRDTNIEDLKPLARLQAGDIARFACNKSLGEYDRGVCWQKEEMEVIGTEWKSAYLPVWLYSYLQVSNEKKILHYVAVNARSKETMGSVPINIPRLLLASLVVEIFGLIAMLFVDSDYSWLFLTLGFIYYFIMYRRYRNSNARHKHEIETKYKLSNLKENDVLIKRKIGLSNSMMIGANNMRVNGSSLNNNIKNELLNNSSNKDA